MADRLVPISAKQLHAEVPKAVKAALERNAAKFPGAKYEPGIFVTSWLIGFILRDLQLDKGTFADAHALAAEVAKPLGGREPAALIYDKRIICGYFPEPGFPLLRE